MEIFCENVVQLLSYNVHVFAFPRNWVPAFKLNTLKLGPLLPGTNLGHLWAKHQNCHF